MIDRCTCIRKSFPLLMASCHHSAPKKSHYTIGEKNIVYDEDLVGKRFFYKPRASNQFVLIKVYRRTGGKSGYESVAVMDAKTYEHVAYASVNNLYRAVETERSFDDALAVYLQNLLRSQVSSLEEKNTE